MISMNDNNDDCREGQEAFESLPHEMRMDVLRSVLNALLDNGVLSFMASTPIEEVSSSSPAKIDPLADFNFWDA